MDIQIRDPRLLEGYNKITDGGKSLRHYQSGKFLSEMLPEFDLDKIKFKLPYPDALLKDAIDTKLLERASEFFKKTRRYKYFFRLVCKESRIRII